jgi:hypothetical protein
MTETETRTAVSRLGSAALTQRLARTGVTGADKKGRTLVEFVGTETREESEFFTLCALLKLTRLMGRTA